VIGSHELAEEIKDRVGKFLKDKLALTLSQEKTRITNARTEEAEFLGYRIRKGTGKWTIESQRASQESWRHSIGNKYRYVRHVTRGYTGESTTA
jgi:hypothetical protein